MVRRILLYLCFFFTFIPGIVSAQSIPMTVDLYEPTQFPKGDGPVSFAWQCSVSATGLLEGYFLVSVRDGSDHYGQFKSHDVALHSGFHEIPMTLPPMKVNNAFGEVKLKLSFVTKKKRHDFKDEYTLHVGRKFQRAFAIGVCDPFDVRYSSEVKQLLDDLKFESISPKQPIVINQKIFKPYLRNRNFVNNQPVTLDVKTFSIQVRPDEFPQLPIDCHRYDVLVMTPRGFDLLETRHLKAIQQWVRSGGSLCVITSSSPGDPQLQFLNNLIEGQTNPPFLLDSEGKLDSSQSQNVWLQRTGWGRSVVILSDALEQKSVSDRELDQIPYFLWKLRESQKDYYEKEQSWDYQSLIKTFLETQKRTNYSNMSAYSVNEMLSLNYRPISSGGAVVTSLMPSEMRIVPSWIIMFVLLAYVLIIGPGEYYILGKLQIRRFTWITFPLISIGFALIAFMISDHYMQTSYERKVMTICDLDAKGNPVKENQIELLFTGSYQQIETKIKSGLLAPLNHTELGMPPNYHVYARNMTPSMVGPPLYAGSIPTQYSVIQLMPQWTPQLNRIVQNYPEELSTSFDWSQIQVNQLNTDKGRQKINERVKASFGKRAQLKIYKGGSKGEVKMFNLFQGKDYLEHHRGYSKKYALMQPMNHYQYYAGYQNIQRSFIDDLCVRNQMGLFQIVSQTSPSGGKNYEDLSILDPSDPRQWLVVVYVPGEDRDTIYRQFIVAKN